MRHAYLFEGDRNNLITITFQNFKKTCRVDLRTGSLCLLLKAAVALKSSSVAAAGTPT